MTPNVVRLATGPVSWGVDFADAPGNPPWPVVLDDIQASGVSALELGPVGYLPEDPALLREALTSRALTAVGSFVFEDLHDPVALDAVLAVARRACAAISGAGGTVLVIIDRPGPERVATAGRSAAAQRLATRFWRAMVDQVDRIAEIARQHGLNPAFHPHAGSYVEFVDEIDHLLMDTDVDVCLDTGHLVYAGIAAHDAITQYADRLAHIHLKDIDRQVLGEVEAKSLGFWSAIRRGIFCPVGSGALDLPLVAEALGRIEYTGFATIEQDRVAGTGTPLDDLDASIAVLRQAGIGADENDPAVAAEAD